MKIMLVATDDEIHWMLQSVVIIDDKQYREFMQEMFRFRAKWNLVILW